MQKVSKQNIKQYHIKILWNKNRRKNYNKKIYINKNRRDNKYLDKKQY